MDPLIDFWEKVARLKTEPRKGWVKRLRLQRTESVADHSFALSLICLFEGQRRGYDIDKMLRLAVLHDLEEALTGDLTPEEKQMKGESLVRQEKNSAREQLLLPVPKENQHSYRELWSELDEIKTNEARLVHELDRLEMALQANAYSRNGIESTKLREFYESAKEAIQDPKLRNLLNEIAP